MCPTKPSHYTSGNSAEEKAERVWMPEEMDVLLLYFILFIKCIKYYKIKWNVLYFILFGCCLPEASTSLMWDKKGVDSEGREGGKELGEIKGRKGIIKICSRKNLFSIYDIKLEKKQYNPILCCLYFYFVYSLGKGELIV